MGIDIQTDDLAHFFGFLFTFPMLNVDVNLSLRDTLWDLEIGGIEPQSLS